MTAKKEKTTNINSDCEAFYGTERFIELLFSLNKEKYNISKHKTAQWIRNCVNVFENNSNN